MLLFFNRERSIGSSRPISGGGKGSIPPHAQSDEESIYDNKRFLHACATLVGAPVSVRTQICLSFVFSIILCINAFVKSQGFKFRSKIMQSNFLNIILGHRCNFTFNFLSFRSRQQRVTSMRGFSVFFLLALN